LNKYLSQLFNL